MPARTLFVAAALCAAWFSVAQARDLTVVVQGERMADAIRQHVAAPFGQITGLPVHVETWSGSLDALRGSAKAADTPWDIVEVGAEELASGCSEGLFEKLDWSAIGGKDHFLPQGVSDCGVGALMTEQVLAWDKDKSPNVPTWADFWDVAKYPGKRGLYKGVRGNLEFALIADGVAPGDVYKVLGTNDGLDRAFRKLDQLKPYIVWWQTGEEAARILSSGDVLMTTAPVDQIIMADRLKHRNFGIQWTAGISEVGSWAIVKGSPNLHQAQQFLYFAGLPALQGRLFEDAAVAGLARGADDALPPEIQALSPTSPANLNNALRVDTGFWHDNLAKLQQRFDKWLEGH